MTLSPPKTSQVLILYWRHKRRRWNGVHFSDIYASKRLKQRSNKWLRLYSKWVRIGWMCKIHLGLGSWCSWNTCNENDLGFNADPLPLSSWPGRDEMGDDTVLHRYTIYLHFSHNWPLFISIWLRDRFSKYGWEWVGSEGMATNNVIFWSYNFQPISGSHGLRTNKD